VRWSATVLLGLVFILALIVALAADLVSRDLLNPDLYNNALKDEDIYNRVYTDLLADPAMVEVTALMLGNLGLDPSLSVNLLSLATSTLYLVAPPDAIQSAVEGTIFSFTSYLAGDTEELDPEIAVKNLDPGRIASVIQDGAMALIGELIAEVRPEVRDEIAALDEEELVRYMGEISSGTIGAVPENLANASLEGISAEQRSKLVERLFGPSYDSASADVVRQVDMALRYDDLPGAMALASRELIQDQASEAADKFVDRVSNSEEMDSLTSAANALGETKAELITRLNSIRSVMIFLDGVAIPIAFIVMILALGGIVWIHADNLTDMLRSSAVVLIVASAIVALSWLIIGLVLRDGLDARFAAGSDLPASLESMIADVVANLSSTVWRDVWQTATTPLVLGLLLLLLSFMRRLLDRVNQWLRPVWQYHKIILVVAILAIVLVPLGLRSVFAERQQPELVCNGHEELCDRPINEVAVAATHNGMSITEYKWIWPSHDGSITNQLNAGIRGLLIDSHYWDDKAWIEAHLEELPPAQQVAVQDLLDEIELGKEDGTWLCHMMCSLGATDLAETLTEIRRFLDSHPNEVLVIIIEDIVSTEETTQAFEESGLDKLVYTYQDGSDWPTLREMIESNQRVLVMAENEGSPPDWYLHAWDYTEETPYLFSELADFDDTSCQPNRGDTDKPFFLMNHWITRASPSRVDASVLNDYDYLLSRAQKCAEERGQIPNLVGINFYLNGDVFEVVDELNGVRQDSEN
jgi:hypothetical protein